MAVRLLAALSGGGIALMLAAGPAGAQQAPAPPMPGAVPGVAASSANSLDVFYTGTDGRVYDKAPGQAPVLVGGHLVGGPAAVWFPPGSYRDGLLAVFGRGTDNALWWTHKSASGWSAWTSLGGQLTAEPTAAADPYGFAYGVFVRGADGALWARFGVPGTTRWGSWVRGGGKLLAGTAPAAAYDSLGGLNGGAYVAVVGTNGRVYERFGGFPGPGLWQSLGGHTTSTPALTAPSRYNGGHSPGGTVVLFARGTDNAAWYYELVGSTPGVTLGWHSTGGRLTSGLAATTPAPASGPIATTPTSIAGLGADGQIWLDSGTWPNLGGWHQLR